MDPGEINRRIEVWGKVASINELLEKTYVDTKLKTIWSAIIPQIGKMQRGQVENIVANVTAYFKVRYNSGKDIAYDNWIMFKGKRHDIKYILNPFERNEFLEIFCTEVIE
jgi:SPP1 family predicted phage head-tail adaptor